MCVFWAVAGFFKQCLQTMTQARHRLLSQTAVESTQESISIIYTCNHTLTLHRLSPVGHSKTRSLRQSVQRAAPHFLWADGHR